MSGEHSCNRFHTLGHSCVRVSLIIILRIKHEFLCIVSEQGCLILIQLNFSPRIVTLTGHWRCTLEQDVAYGQVSRIKDWWMLLEIYTFGFLGTKPLFICQWEKNLLSEGGDPSVALSHWLKNFSFHNDEQNFFHIGSSLVSFPKFSCQG